MQEVREASASVDGGLFGDVKSSIERGITLLSAGQWQDVSRELKAELPWHTRRANVLVDSGGLAHLIGQTIRLGDLEVEVLAETKPCGYMDKLFPGLRAALKPECRAGVYGRIRRGGMLRVGDMVRVMPAGADRA